MNALLAFGKLLQSTPWGAGVRTSLWAYPYVQLIHFTGLSLWLATNITVDLRLLGVWKRRQTAAELNNALLLWNWTAFCIVVLGGFMLFSASAVQYLRNPAFQFKLGLFVPMALIWHIVVQRKAPVWGKEAETLPMGKIAGLIEILLWICVVSAAVEIPSY